MSLRAKEADHQFAGLVRQDPLDELGAVVQARVGQHLPQRGRSAELRVADPPDDAGDPRMRRRSGAQEAGLERREELAADEPLRTDLARGAAQGQHLGVGCRIAQRPRAVVGPREQALAQDDDRKVVGHNPLCGDKLVLSLQVDDDVVADAHFQGEGCAISKASASLMTEALKGHHVSDFLPLFEKFQHMVTADMSEEPDEEVLGKLAVLAGVREFPSRIKCASLCWHTMKSAIEGGQVVAKTE